MSANQTCYGPIDGVTGAPTIDGIVEPEPGLVTDPAGDTFEPGYTGGSRINFQGETGVNNVVISGVSNNVGSPNGTLYLGFVVRMVPGFNVGDNIAIVLHPNASAGPSDITDKRRIDITPVGNAGASGADDTFTPNPNHVKTNRAPQGSSVTVRRAVAPVNAGDPVWSDPVGAPLDVNLANFACKVRSWIFNANDYGFSVEIAIPLTKDATAGGGTDWIALDGAAQFGIYVNINVADEQLVPVNGEHISFQFAWPAPDYTTGIGLFMDDINEPITVQSADVPNAWLGKAGFSVAACAGVQFAGGAQGIGVIDPANPTGDLLSYLSVDTSAGLPSNPLAARLINTDASSSATNVQVTFRFADWGIPNAGSNSNGWNEVPNGECVPGPEAAPGSHGDPVTLATVNTTSTQVSTVWTMTTNAEVNEFATANGGHQCMVAELSSADPASFFVQDAVRRNMDFYPIPLSRNEQDFTIDARHYAPGSSTTALPQQILLRTSIRHVTIPERKPVTPTVRTPPKTPGDVTQDAIFLHSAFRRTQWTVHVDRVKHVIWQPIGTFGQLATHTGPPADQFDHAFSLTTPRAGTVSPSSFEEVLPNVYLLGAPTGHKVSLRTTIAAGEEAVPRHHHHRHHHHRHDHGRDREAFVGFLRAVSHALHDLIERLEHH